MKRAETCSCSLCNKLYISLPPYSCVRQVYTLQSDTHTTLVIMGALHENQYTFFKSHLDHFFLE